jgi:hypothetical protein
VTLRSQRGWHLVRRKPGRDLGWLISIFETERRKQPAASSLFWNGAQICRWQKSGALVEAPQRY